MEINADMKHELSMWKDTLKAHQKDDPDCLLTKKISMERKMVDGSLRYVIRDDILYENDHGYKPLIPATLRRRLLNAAHGTLLAGHRGEHVTFERLKSEYTWPKMRQDVREYVQSCESCSVNKISNPQLVKIPQASRADASAPAFLRVEVDVKGPLKLTSRGNLFFITFVDLATRWAEAYPVPDITAETTAKVYTEGVVCRHGIPEVLYSDRGSNFTSKEFKQFVAKALGGKQVFNTAYSARSSGTVERVHQTVQMYLNQFRKQEPNTEWDALLPYALAAYRSAYHQSLGCSPFQALYGRQFRALPTLDTDRLARLEDLPEGWMFETATRIDHIKKLMTARQIERRQGDESGVNPIKVGDYIRVKLQAKQRERGRYSEAKKVLATTPHTVTITDPTVDEPNRTKCIHVKNVKRTKSNPALGDDNNVEISSEDDTVETELSDAETESTSVDPQTKEHQLTHPEEHVINKEAAEKVGKPQEDVVDDLPTSEDKDASKSYVSFGSVCMRVF
jgi:hypothetical protein